MAEPHWTSYVGMAAGIFGAIMGYVSIRRSNQIKSLDLRLELRKSINNYNAAISKAKELMPRANKSRERVASAMGNYNSGAMVQWKQEYEKDNNALGGLSNDAPCSGSVILAT